MSCSVKVINTYVIIVKRHGIQEGNKFNILIWY